MITAKKTNYKNKKQLRKKNKKKYPTLNFSKE